MNYLLSLRICNAMHSSAIINVYYSFISTKTRKRTKWFSSPNHLFPEMTIQKRSLYSFSWIDNTYFIRILSIFRV